MPSSAVAVTSERTFVVRINGDVAEGVDVKKSGAEGDFIDIIGPLKVGDTVLRSDSDEIREGT